MCSEELVKHNAQENLQMVPSLPDKKVLRGRQTGKDLGGKVLLEQ